VIKNDKFNVVIQLFTTVDIRQQTVTNLIHLASLCLLDIPIGQTSLCLCNITQRLKTLRAKESMLAVGLIK